VKWAKVKGTHYKINTMIIIIIIITKDILKDDFASIRSKIKIIFEVFYNY